MAKQPTVESAPDHGASSHLFLFDLDLAIRDQVVKKLISSHEFPLETGVAPSMSGIYALYHNGKLVYVGKASKETTKSERT
ncbi:MAG: hypothetical protein NT069_17835, partial [Planctomycetota bacterium]|nr:hypothetical protein [Planctomycetota bacterium]